MGRSASLVNGKDVRVFFWVLNYYSSDKSSQIDDMDSWHEVLSLSDEWKLVGVLDPRLLEVIVEDALSISVSYTRAEDVDSELWLSVD